MADRGGKSPPFAPFSQSSSPLSPEKDIPLLPSHKPGTLLTLPAHSPPSVSSKTCRSLVWNTTHLLSLLPSSLIHCQLGPHPSWASWFYSLICFQLGCQININRILFPSCLKLFESFICLSNKSFLRCYYDPHNEDTAGNKTKFLPQGAYIPVCVCACVFVLGGLACVRGG